MIFNEIKAYLSKLDNYDLRSHADVIQKMVHKEVQEAVELVHFCDEHYSREIIHQINDFDIVLIGWKSGQLSPIHDHPTNGCIVYPIAGTLSEWRYNTEMEMISSTRLRAPAYTYIDNGICIHKLGNEDTQENAISVHVYSPCNYKANIYQCEKNKNHSTVALP